MNLDKQTRYQVEESVGEGGMGVVYRIVDKELGREVALKTVQANWRQDESLLAFVQEARATSQLEHPNILPVYDLGRDDEGVPFYTMPLVKGHTLAHLIERLQGRDAPLHAEFTMSRRMLLAQKICEALEFAHGRGVLHRDLKPDNIMIGAFGEVFVMDWGLAGQAQQAGPVVGTPGYMAPEILNKGDYTQASDLYALGTVLYELLGLAPAFPGSSPNTRLAANRVARPKSADSFRNPLQGRLPKEVSNIIMRLLEVRPEKRQQSAREVREALAAYLDGDAPVTCICTGAKRATFGLGHAIDQLGPLAVVLAAAWLVLPVLFMLLVATGVLHYG